MKTLIASAVGLLAFVSLGATEYFADAKNGNDAWDGKSATHEEGTDHGPKLSIQAAVDLAQDGSTAAAMNIVTLAPGDYTNGVRGVTSGGYVTSNRVYITYPVCIRSSRGRETRDETRIVGFRDRDAATCNLGAASVRCALVASTADGTRFEGVTFVGGAAYYCSGAGTDPNGGGAVWGGSGSVAAAYLIDCAVIDCHGRQGGGVYNATLVRTLVANCSCTHYGLGTRYVKAYNCVYYENYINPLSAFGQKTSAGAAGYPSDHYNCTFFGNQTYGMGAFNGAPKAYNCLFVYCGDKDGVYSGITAKNCVSENSTLTTDGCRVVAAETLNEIFSPADGDWRLMPGATALTTGDAQWLGNIPEEFRSTDYYGNPRKTGEVVYAGAVQAVATPMGLPTKLGNIDESYGRLTLDDNLPAIGRPTYLRSATSNRVVRMSFAPAAGRDLVCFTQGDQVRWPLRDGTCWLLLRDDQTQTVNAITTDNIVYVDANNGSDDAATNDGSSAKPWKTLQKAVQQTAKTLVIARAGDYDSCGDFDTVWQNLTNRVLVTSTAQMRVLAEEGPEKTFITGAADTTNPVRDNTYGEGPASVRCVAVQKGCCCAFQGFTLRDGHSSQGPNAGDNDAPEAHGAAFLNGAGTENYKTGWLLDCVVTNCTGSRGGAAYGGVCERTLFDGNLSTRLGLFRYADLRSCVVRNNSAQTRNLLEDISSANNTTFVANKAWAVSYAYIYNCVLADGVKVGGLVHNEGGKRQYSLWETATGTKSSTEEITGCVEDLAGLADPVQGDYRLNSASAAVNLGVAASLKSAMDFTGRPFAVTADGRVNAGAFAETVPGVRVASSEMAGTKKSTLYAFGEDDSVEVSLPATGVYGRALCGYAVGGVTQAISSATVTVTKEQAMVSAPYVMNPVYLSHFYVDVDGSDDNDGGSEATAFQTLAKASSVARVAGDVVTVLPGTYDEKTIKVEMADHGWESAMKVLCRLAVYPGVTFESRDGAEATVVKGASATGTVGVDVDANGCGTNGAVRCAFVGDGGVLRGFTLSGGRTRNGNLPADGSADRQGVDFCCAGVLAPSSAGANQADQWSRRLVENCIFDDCYAPRGSVARCVLLRNCKITKCRGINLGPTIRECRVENCLITGNYTATIYNSLLFNCTLDTNVNRGSGYDYPIVNCAFLSKSTQTAGAFTNCAFKTGSTINGANVNPLTVDYFKLDDNSCPMAISPLRDAGDRTLVPEGCETDLWGNQRVYNAQVDIGCCEYDWRGDYAAALGSRKLTVDTADSDVTLADATTVSLPKGELTATWRTSAAGTGVPYSFTAQVTGTGTLTVTREGAGTPVAVITQGDAQTITFNSPDEATQLAFAYMPGENDTGAALLSGFRHNVGTMILLR